MRDHPPLFPSSSVPWGGDHLPRHLPTMTADHLEPDEYRAHAGKALAITGTLAILVEAVDAMRDALGPLVDDTATRLDECFAAARFLADTLTALGDFDADDDPADALEPLEPAP